MTHKHARHHPNKQSNKKKANLLLYGFSMIEFSSLSFFMCRLSTIRIEIKHWMFWLWFYFIWFQFVSLFLCYHAEMLWIGCKAFGKQNVYASNFEFWVCINLQSGALSGVRECVLMGAWVGIWLWMCGHLYGFILQLRDMHKKKMERIFIITHTK